MSTGCRISPPKKRSTPLRIEGRHVVREEFDVAKACDLRTPGGGGDDAGGVAASLRRRRSLHAVHCFAVAGSAGRRRLACGVRRRNPRPRAGLQAARPDPARTPRDGGAVAGRVRAGAGRLRQGSQHRQAGSGGAEADGEASRRARRNRNALRRARHRGAGDLGTRNRLRPPQAALRWVARAGDAGLCRPPQGAVSHRVHRGAEADRRPRGHAQAICARPGPAPPALPSSCRPNSASTASISTATAAATSGIRCRMRSLPRHSSSSTRAGNRVCAGPTKCALPLAPIAPWVCPT